MLSEICSQILYTMGVSPESGLGQALHFFIYDSVKILLLLFSMITVIGILRSYIPRKRFREWVSKARYGTGYVLAAAFGSLTPFCSCSSIPIFISFLETGIPLGPTFTFLVTSPLINEYLAVLMLGFFGWKITAAYIISGMTLGIAAGVLINHLDVEDQIREDLISPQEERRQEYPGFMDRVRYGLNEARDIVKKLWIWVLVGVGIGALIHGYIPQKTIQGVLQRTGVFSVPLAALIGIPIYANCSAVVPIALVLFEKGMPLGTALAFMMATAALSLPEAGILRRAMKTRLIILFFGLVGTGIIITGYVFNLLAGMLA